MKRRIAILFLLLSCCSICGAETIDVKGSTDKTGHPINPFIYSQFIEHMGRCIYGGIWAEMLEDRKFYFPITENYQPYRDYADTPFPAVSSSPWQIVGPVEGVENTTADSFVGEYTPLIKAGSGIQQHDLGVVEGKRYVGYIWLKTAGSAPAQVELSLTEREGAKPAWSTRVAVSGEEYVKFPFSFDATESSDHASLAVRVTEGACLLGTLSLMPGDNVRGMRADTLKLLKELNAPMYRWPGGNFVSGYDWRDGIGDRDRRPPRPISAWVGVEHNDFGTDEFIDFCRELGTEPMIAVNTGLGDAYSAAQWVEYCNAATDSVGGGWRAKNGSEIPFGVRYWCVGNEMWGNWQLGHMHLDHYVMKHNRTAEAMKEVDASVILVGSGDLDSVSTGIDSTKKRGWTEGMLQDCADNMDLISEHFYRGRTPWTDTGRTDVLNHVRQIADAIREKATRHRELQASMPHLEGRFIPIAMDEWNYWHREYVYGDLGCIYELQDALGIANGFHEYYRNGDIIPMAHYAQTVNVIGAIKTTKTAAEFDTTGLVLKLYRNHYGTLPLLLEEDYGNYGVAAALNDTGSLLTVSVVNPTQEPIDVSLLIDGVTLLGGGTRWHITGPEATSFNVPGKPRVVDLHETRLQGKSPRLEVPALSCALFELPIEQEKN